MHTRTLVSVACCLALLTACGGGGGQPNPPTNSYTLAGTVRTPAGAAIAGAQVLVGQSSAVTNLDGSFAFPGLPAGFYIASVQDPHGNFSCRQLQLSANSTAFTFELPTAPAGFEVVVIDPLLNSTGSEVNNDIRITFSQPVSLAAATNAADWFSPGIGAFTTSLSLDQTTLNLDPLLQLPLDQQITVELPAVFTSGAGDTLGHTVRWRFRTEVTDTAPPQLITTTPDPGSDSHPINLSVVFEFNEPLAGDPLPVAACEPVEDLSCTASGRFLYIQAGGGWQPATAYSMQVTGVADQAGNAFASPLALTFTTGSEAAPSDDIQPAWNREVNSIVYASNSYGSFDIFQTSLDDTALVRLTALPGDELHPSVSRDGSRLVFQYREPGGRWHIMVQRLDGTGDSVTLTAGNFNNQQPVFSNTISNQLTFVSDRVDPPGLFLMNSDGTNLREVDRLFGSEQTSPAFHPLLDTQLLFASGRAGSLDIWRKTVSAIDGSSINLNLTGGSLSRETSPVFSADASYILFISDYSGVNELWLADADGAFPRQVTYFDSDVADPALSPVAGVTDCVVSLPLAAGGRGLALVDAVSGNLTRWLTGGEAVH
jgi:Tol biopolymer transport system component